MNERNKKKLYSQLDDRYLKMLLGKAFKKYDDYTIATTIQSIVRLFPMTRRFDDKTIKILKDNCGNQHFRKMLLDRLK